jgi:leucyl aminopeptidase
MQVKFASGAPEKQKAGVLIVGAFADGKLSPAGQALDAASKGKIGAALKRGDLDEKAGAVLVLSGLDGIAAERVMVVSLGKHDGFGDQAYRDGLAGAAKALANGKAADAVLPMTAEVPGRSLAWRIETTARILADGAYKFDYPRQKKDDGKRGAKTLTLLLPGKADAKAEAALKRGLAIASGMALTKDLGNHGGNVCNPGYMAETARKLGKAYGFEVKILEREDMEKLGMHSALSVGRASYSPCKMIVMHYDKGGKSKPIVLVGKGLTFDTGGVSIKGSNNLDEMKYDMSGGGTVLGTFKAVAEMGLKINLVGIVMAHENMLGGNASRPGDVVKTMSGLSVEILNTDAEGRLVLCDALTYAERYKPDCVIDMATLTGACIVALGHHTSAVLANDDALAAELIASGTDAGDRAWQLPLWDVYMPQLKSNFADMSNLGGPAAGTITAALFLSKFATAYKWAHMDIAGTASVSGPDKGATGRPLPLIASFLMKRAGVKT